MRNSFNVTVNIGFPRCVISINMRMISPKQVVIITPPRKESAPRSTLKRYVFTWNKLTTDFFIHFSSCHSTFHKNHMRITILIRSTFSEKDREKNYEYLIILWRKILPVITRTSSSYGVTHLIKKVFIMELGVSLYQRL